ncbi:actinia tenebrosa protease inhibitors-like [Amblyomma americanum]
MEQQLGSARQQAGLDREGVLILHDAIRETHQTGITRAATDFKLPEECEIPEEVPRCRANLPAWVYNKTSGYCENLPNGKCYKSGNFDTEEDCNTKCRDPLLGVCAKQLQAGNCRASVRRYAFSTEMRRCRLHMGCYSVEDNGNNFATFKECNKKCGEFAQDPCLLPQEKGVQCRNGRPAPPGVNTYFSFNQKTERCESFAYTGCGGNRNRFEEEADCWRVCSKHINNSCNMPISDGHICPRNDQGGSYEAYGYNSKTGRCESFLFKGCGGNSNRFPTAKECWTKCAIPFSERVLNPNYQMSSAIHVFASTSRTNVLH